MTVVCRWCNGRGGYYGSDEWHPCPRCHGELEAEERAAEEWKAAGFDDMSPLEQWHADANR